jgi:hypothetical protein
MFEDFIRQYSSLQKSMIEYKWNGHTGYDEWDDENREFRQKIIERVLVQKIIAPDVLIRDLFEIEAIFSREAFGAGATLEELGNLLLHQTGTKFIADYFIGKGQSFDTENTVIPYGVSIAVLEKVLQDLYEQNHRVATDANKDIEWYISYFEDHIQSRKLNQA